MVIVLNSLLNIIKIQKLFYIFFLLNLIFKIRDLFKCNFFINFFINFN